MAFRLTGPLDSGHLSKALAGLTRRQAILRTSFSNETGIPIQHVSPESEIDFEVVDISHVRMDDRDAETVRLIQTEASRPFMLTRAPLMRVRLVRYNSREHVVFFIVHHIISDLWSMKVLWKELAQFCAFAAEGGPEPAPLSVQYVDYANRQRGWFSGNALEKQVDYLRRWARDVPDFRMPNLLPYDETTRSGDVVSLEIPEELGQAIRQISREQRVTVFMMFLALFHVFLRHYTGAERFLIAAMVANRPSTDLEALIGVFSTSLALKMDLSAKPALPEIITQTREVCLDAYSNQYLPMWQLAELGAQDLDSRRLRPRISFTLQTAPLKSPEIPGLTVVPFACNGAAIFEDGAGAVAAFDQAWEVWEAGSGYNVVVVYRRCFQRRTVECMLKVFVEIIDSVVSTLTKRSAAVTEKI